MKPVSPFILVICKLLPSWVQNRKQQHLAYTVLAASDVHTLEGIQLLLSLALAFWLKSREGDIPAESSKVK